MTEMENGKQKQKKENCCISYCTCTQQSRSLESSLGLTSFQGTEVLSSAMLKYS